MTKPKKIPFSKSDLEKIFSYKDGNLIWKRRGKGIKTGCTAGFKTPRGYINVVIDGIIYRAHRIIFVLHHDYEPTEVDHINQNKSDNKIENLREVTRSKNLQNQKGRRSNKGKLCGVSMVRGYYRVSICVNYNHIQLGQRKDYFEACCIRKSAENKYFK